MPFLGTKGQPWALLHDHTLCCANMPLSECRCRPQPEVALRTLADAPTFQHRCTHPVPFVAHPQPYAVVVAAGCQQLPGGVPRHTLDVLHGPAHSTARQHSIAQHSESAVSPCSGKGIHHGHVCACVKAPHACVRGCAWTPPLAAAVPWYACHAQCSRLLTPDLQCLRACHHLSRCADCWPRLFRAPRRQPPHPPSAAHLRVAVLDVHAVILLPEPALPEPHRPVAAAGGDVVAAGRPGH